VRKIYFVKLTFFFFLCVFFKGEARLEEEERKKRLKHHKKLYQTNLTKKSQLNYEANYAICYDIAIQIADFSTKLAHYRELTKK